MDYIIIHPQNPRHRLGCVEAATPEQAVLSFIHAGSRPAWMTRLILTETEPLVAIPKDLPGCWWEGNIYPFHIFYRAANRQEHIFALQQGDPVLGCVDAATEQEAVELATVQGLGNGHPIIAVYLAKGCPYRSVSTGRVSPKFPLSGSILWYPLGYWEERWTDVQKDPELLKLHLANTLREMEAQRDQMGDDEGKRYEPKYAETRRMWASLG